MSTRRTLGGQSGTWECPWEETWVVRGYLGTWRAPRGLFEHSKGTQTLKALRHSRGLRALVHLGTTQTLGHLGHLGTWTLAHLDIRAHEHSRHFIQQTPEISKKSKYKLRTFWGREVPKQILLTVYLQKNDLNTVRVIF